MITHLLKLARPKQWSKSAFVLIGPLYALADGNLTASGLLPSVFAAIAFALASSACYTINDVQDADADRAHPRKKNRPIASGAITPATASAFGAVLLLLSAGCLLGIPASNRLWTGVMLGCYAGSTLAYSLGIKHRVIADVIVLAMGFVLRMLGGCAATGIMPTTFLLSATFFLAMFLAFGKRLGERRTLGDVAGAARAVQLRYSDATLQLCMIATGVVTLVTYAFYVMDQDKKFKVAFTDGLPPNAFGFNLLWLTVLPAPYALFRCIVLMDRGEYDDPTELATRDRPFQLAALLFVAITVALVLARHRQMI